ncbi:hypothetical protein J132_03877, partial [Termitomyces sp. J132]
SFHMKLPASMKQCGIHNIFHASLLRIHIPNNNHLFPGQLDAQVVEPQQHPTEWAAEKIVSHTGSGGHLLFEVLWKSGDRTWLLHNEVEDLTLLQLYLDAIRVENVAELPISSGPLPPHDPQIFLDLWKFSK